MTKLLNDMIIDIKESFIDFGNSQLNVNLASHNTTTHVTTATGMISFDFTKWSVLIFMKTLKTEITAPCS